MTIVLLREYVDLVIERIRTTKNVDSERGRRFDFSKFKRLDDIDDMLHYASLYLEFLGKGSSRAAFIFSSRYALKVALNDKGLAQNEAEVNVYTNPTSKPIVAKIQAFDPRFRWLVSELVNPLQNEGEFKKLSGTDWEEFIEQIYDINIAGQHQEGRRYSPIALATATTMKQNQLLLGDIDAIPHWGKTHDGRVVLLDYGLTSDIAKTHYPKQGGKVDAFANTIRVANAFSDRTELEHAGSTKKNT